MAGGRGLRGLGEECPALARARFLSSPKYKAQIPKTHWQLRKIWAEIQMFQKSLVQMFEDKYLGYTFLKTNTSMKKQYHVIYECIPVPKEEGDMPPVLRKQ